jgi:hypothetical protein
MKKIFKQDEKTNIQNSR